MVLVRLPDVRLVPDFRVLAVDPRLVDALPDTLPDAAAALSFLISLNLCKLQKIEKEQIASIEDYYNASDEQNRIIKPYLDQI